MIKIKGLNDKLKNIEQEIKSLGLGVELTRELDDKYMVLVEKCEDLEGGYLLVELLEKDEQGFHSILVNSNTMELGVDYGCDMCSDRYEYDSIMWITSSYGLCGKCYDGCSNGKLEQLAEKFE